VNPDKYALNMFAHKLTCKISENDLWIYWYCFSFQKYNHLPTFIA